MTNLVEAEVEDSDIDYLLQGFSGDLGFDISPELLELELDPPPQQEQQCPSPDSSAVFPLSDTVLSPGSQSDVSPGAISCYVSEIEKFLMEEEEQEEGGAPAVQDDFFAVLFAQGSDHSDVGDACDEAAEKKRDAPLETLALGGGEEDDDDPMSKKRRRQMRNRDSAMKSRERKKMYVKELELKSKHLEMECRRLDYALRCCAAENLALHQLLQKERSLGAPAAKQESAELFVESLLLGSLFWLVSTVYLFLMPKLCNQNHNYENGGGRDLVQEVVVPKKITNERSGRFLESELGSMGKRCRGMRARIKFCLFPLRAVSA